MTAHILGLPIEESLLQFLPVAAVTLTAVVVGGRASLDRLRHRIRHRSGAER